MASSMEKHLQNAPTMPFFSSGSPCFFADRCAYAVYSTRKHEGAAPRLRIILPLDEPCTADEYEPIARKAATRSSPAS